MINGWPELHNLFCTTSHVKKSGISEEPKSPIKYSRGARSRVKKLCSVGSADGVKPIRREGPFDRVLHPKGEGNQNRSNTSSTSATCRKEEKTSRRSPHFTWPPVGPKSHLIGKKTPIDHQRQASASGADLQQNPMRVSSRT